jgi:Phage gp6-like head-tail connector protein
MKINQITLLDIKNYLHVYHDEDDILLTSIMSSAISFVRNYTGLSPEQLNISDDLSMVVFIIAAELYDNRVYTVDKNNVNPVIQTILDMHSVNLL